MKEGGGGMGGQIDSPTPEKTTLKKPSFIRVKVDGMSLEKVLNFYFDSFF